MVAAQARIWSYIFSIGAPPPLPICLCGMHGENFETKTEVGVNTHLCHATLWLLFSSKFYQLSQSTRTSTGFIDGSKTFARRSRSILYYMLCFQCSKFWV